MFDEFQKDWYSIIMTTRYAAMMSSDFRDKIVIDGVIECIIPNCENSMFTVTMFVESLFPPFCTEQSVEVFKHFLPLFKHLFMIDDIHEHANLILKSIMTTPMNNEIIDAILEHGMMVYFEELRQSNDQNISSMATKIVKEINIASLLDGA
jgi:hypothetical protein